ncbi:unnamed protein product [Caenorhabditis nigoni]
MVRRRLDDFKQILEQKCLKKTIDKCNQAFETFLQECKKGTVECQEIAEKGKDQFCQEHSYSDYCISSTASPTTPNSTTINTTTTASLPTTSLKSEATTEASFVLTPTHYIIAAGIGGFLILGLALLVKWILDKKKPAKKQKKTKKKHPEFTIESPSNNFTRSRTW